MRNLSVNRSDSGEAVKVEFVDAVSVAEIFSRAKEVKEGITMIYEIFIKSLVFRISSIVLGGLHLHCRDTPGNA